MGNILWLASYPRSGNTWLRAFLHNYLRNSAEPYDINRLQDLTTIDSDARWYRMFDARPCSSLSKEEVAVLRPKVHEAITQSRPDTVFVKTHNASVIDRGTPMVSPQFTAGAIYVVRDPLDVAVSYSVHFGVTLDEAVAAMNRTANQSKSNEANFVYELHGSWSENVESWTGREQKGVHVVRYEDLQSVPEQAFGGIVRFLGLPGGHDRLQRAIRNCAFAVLETQEQQGGFRERSRKSDKFFRSGRSGEGTRRLTPDQIAALRRSHEGQMRRFGYWQSGDSPVAANSDGPPR
jgi:sulfotransferase family protein